MASAKASRVPGFAGVEYPIEGQGWEDTYQPLLVLILPWSPDWVGTWSSGRAHGEG